MIELDIQLSKDGIPVVFHDADVRKTSDGIGILSEMSTNKIKQLDAGSWFSKKYAGEKIPLLEEVLDWLPENLLLNIEIKPEAVSEQTEAGVEKKVIDMVHKFELGNRVVLSSFSYLAVKRFKEFAPGIKTGLLYEKNQSAGKMPAELLEHTKADLFHCSTRQMNSGWAGQLKNQQKPFLIYTVNRKRTMQKFIRLGASGLFSDKPDLLKKVYAEMQQL